MSYCTLLVFSCTVTFPICLVFDPFIRLWPIALWGRKLEREKYEGEEEGWVVPLHWTHLPDVFPCCGAWCCSMTRWLHHGADHYAAALLNCAPEAPQQRPHWFQSNWAVLPLAAFVDVILYVYDSIWIALGFENHGKMISYHRHPQGLSQICLLHKIQYSLMIKKEMFFFKEDQIILYFDCIVF